MVRREYPFELKNNLDRFVRLKQAQMTVEQNEAITLQEVYKDMAVYASISDNAVGLIKAKNYNPSLVVAMAIAQYLDTTVDELFTISRKED